MNIAKRVPNLICIGMEKSGTTFLNAVFKKSQSVLTPTKKELFYYNLHYDQGLDWYLSWYDYNSKPDAAYVCDVTPSYFRRREAISRIKETSPDAKLLVLIRHPVYRAFSHYIHRLRHVGLKLENYPSSFQEVFEGANGKRDVFPPYYETLSLWLEEFKREDILFLSYESELFDPDKVEQKMHDFLGIDDLDFGQFRGTRINNGKMPKFYYGGVYGKKVTINEREFLIPKDTLVFAHVKGTKVWSDIEPVQANMALEASAHWTAKLSSDEVRQIYDNFYARDIALFNSTFDVDVSAWLKSEPVSYRAAHPGDQFLL
ncbi:MAG: hypothetical protein ACJASY_000428 [Halioglobus sp.]|jgi:hypothetical protein